MSNSIEGTMDYMYFSVELICDSDSPKTERRHIKYIPMFRGVATEGREERKGHAPIVD